MDQELDNQVVAGWLRDGFTIPVMMRRAFDSILILNKQRSLNFDIVRTLRLTLHETLLLLFKSVGGVQWKPVNVHCPLFKVVVQWGPVNRC